MVTRSVTPPVTVPSKLTVPAMALSHQSAREMRLTHAQRKRADGKHEEEVVSSVGHQVRLGRRSSFSRCLLLMLCVGLDWTASASTACAISPAMTSETAKNGQEFN